MKRMLVLCVVMVVSASLMACSGGGGSTPPSGQEGSGASSTSEQTAPNGELATDLNGTWTSSWGQTLEWTLAGDKGTVVYVESFDGTDQSQAPQFTGDVDVSSGVADFDYGDGANLIRVRYFDGNMLIAERVSSKTQGVLGCEVYGRTKDAALQAATAFANALPETSGAVATKAGETSYYDRLVSEGLLVLEENMINSPK